MIPAVAAMETPTHPLAQRNVQKSQRLDSAEEIEVEVTSVGQGVRSVVRNEEIILNRWILC